MEFFNRFYLDSEKDIIIDLYRDHDQMTYVLRTPNHKTGNLITNLAELCHLPLSFDAKGLKIIEGQVPAYVNAHNELVYILRLANIKIANIYPDGRIDQKASILAIAKTLMSQTKDYKLSANETIIKSYVLQDTKFKTDLHTHMNANLSADVLMALGIKHQLRYPLYYVKKLKLKLSPHQAQAIEEARTQVAQQFKDSTLESKQLTRKIDDNTFINFADLILNNLDQAEYNIPRIRASLAVLKDGQAVFTNLEKVYLYRYVFAKGQASQNPIALDHWQEIPDPDMVEALAQMLADLANPAYQSFTLFQDCLLWICRTYQEKGITYVEMADTTLVKKAEAAQRLQEIHDCLPAILAETGVRLRFLAALRRIALTIVKDQIPKENYFTENLQVLKAVADDPYIAGCDIVGEEINDIRELKPVIKELVKISKTYPNFVIRIHAGENDSLPDNVGHSIDAVQAGLELDENFPPVRIGHGLHTAKLSSKKGQNLMNKIRDNGVVLEFQLSSNVRLNNLNNLKHHPLKTYLENGIACVQGTDGGAIYGTDSLDEQLALQYLLDLNYDQMHAMCQVENRLIAAAVKDFTEKSIKFKQEKGKISVATYLQDRIEGNSHLYRKILAGEEKYDSHQIFADHISGLPQDKIPLVLLGGSFNNLRHQTRMTQAGKDTIDGLLAQADPSRVFFVIGHADKAYEHYLLEANQGRFEIYAMIPAAVTVKEKTAIETLNLPIRIALDPTPMGVYKSFAYDIFKRRQSIILAFDGNASAMNLIQEAKNARYKSRTFINRRSAPLRMKAKSLEGYITFFEDATIVPEILDYADRYFKVIDDLDQQIYVRAIDRL
ncbi:adenosine deaminase [Eremococcus coleocola]|uniref:adenosine deaminase n=1 Tax=Eremococcus coleocola TaxID=88132 RepID=UPI0003FB8A90|nr:adenosine deaminase [Eremococcus coleocola]